MKQRSLPGFKGVSIYHILTFLRAETQRDDLTTRANSMAFSFIISLFPFLILLFSILTLLPVENFAELIMSVVDDLLPEKAHAFILDLLSAIMHRERAGLLSIGFVLVLYFASNGMMSMMRGFDKQYDLTFRRRSWINKRLVALRLTMIIGLLCIIALVLIFGTGVLINWLKSDSNASNWRFLSIKVGRYFFIFLLYYGIIATIYRLAPPVKNRFSYFSIGTNFATLFSLLSSVIFSWVVDQFGNYNNFYGPLGTLVMVMLWIQINCFILLAGFELNAGIAVYRDRQAEKERV